MSNTDSNEKTNTVTFDGKSYTLDSYGFLNPSDQWDENFAKGMAVNQQIYGGLTKAHWDFIHYVRNKFINENTVPVVVFACADNKIRLREFKKLFPTGYHRGACRIAGINYDFMLKTNYWLTYETAPVLKAEYKLTPLGFLVDFNEWKEDFANLIIREWKLTQGLTDKHRDVIRYLREFYKKTKNIPSIYETCDENSLTIDEFIELFPDGYRRGACRIAGLPFFP